MGLTQLLTTVSTAAASIAGAVLVKLLADDIKECTPNMTQRLIDRAAARLPPEHRDRCSEEWTAEVNHKAGIFPKWWFAAGLQLSEAREVRHAASAAMGRAVAKRLEVGRVNFRDMTTDERKPEAIVVSAMMVAMVVASVVELMFPKWANRVDPDHLYATFGLGNAAGVMSFAIQLYYAVAKERRQSRTLRPPT